MYKTHIEVGKNFYLLSLPVLIKIGVYPNIAELVRGGASTGDVLLSGLTLGASLYVGYKGAMFGAGFPDLDLKGTTPDRKHPIVGKIMRGCGATHRGKFSHSWDSQTIFWFIMYMLSMYGLNHISTSYNMPNWLSGALSINGFLNTIIRVWVINAYVGVLSHLFADIPTGGGIRIFGFMKPIKMKSRFFRTGEDSKWEMFYRKMSIYLTPICVILSVYIYLYK